ncbi:MAG: hypothetical protein ACRDWY_06250 [Actinomycetes bacterium]
MGTRTYRTRAIATGTVGALIAAVTVALTTAAPAEAAVKTVDVRMTANAITFSGGGASTANGVTTLRPGRYHFHVVARGGGHALQLLALRGGYTAEQAQQDFPLAFEGNVEAVQRIDNGVDFRGGAAARPKHPGDMVVALKAGPLLAVDQASPTIAPLNISGKARTGARAPSSGTYTSFTYGWEVTSDLPASGRVKFRNQSDQPHFLVLQRVKESTTNAKVRRFIKSGGEGNPPWVLRGGAESGVLSPERSQLFSYDLRPGKYFIACFWPDYFTGEPHVFHGMWKLVTLR